MGQVVGHPAFLSLLESLPLTCKTAATMQPCLTQASLWVENILGKLGAEVGKA